MFYGIDKRIGKKVWVFEEENHYFPRLNKDKVWVVESLHEPDENNYDYYFTLALANGEDRKKVYWYQVVVLPDGSIDDELSRISKYLSDNGFYNDEMWHERILDTELVRISVSWGDWKHDHGWLNDLMSHIDYDCFGTVVTEEDGSDCYSADHIFVHKCNPRHDLLLAAKKIFG